MARYVQMASADTDPIPRVDGVVFDVDGTLVDSNDAHALAWVEVLAEHGYRATFAEVRPLVGMGGDKVLPILTKLSEESEAGRAIGERRAEIFRRRHLPTIRPFPKVRELVDCLQRDGLRVAVASSASEDDLRALLERASVADLLDRAASKDDAPRSKPDPDVVRAALARLGVPAHRVLMVGDTPYDVEASLRAGVVPIALRCGGYWTDADLRRAVAILDDPAALLAHFDGER